MRLFSSLLNPARPAWVILIAWVSSSLLQARDFRVNLVPNGSTFSCQLCHNSSSGGSRNAFGQDVEQFVSRGGREQFWAQVFSLDSDGDGFTNGEEMGDPDGNGVATPGFRPSRPAVATSVPVINKAPTVTLASNAAGVFVSRSGTLKLSAVAADADGTVAKVEFFVGTTSLGVDTSSPFEFSLDLSTLEPGNISITAKATDNQSSSTTSTPVVVRVRGPLAMDPPSILPDGSVDITWPSLTGSKYVLESSEDLVTWAEVGTLTASGASSKVNEPAGVGAQRNRFYRAREVE